MKEYKGILEKAADIRHTNQKTNAARTQNMLKNVICFNLIVRTINPIQISDIQASAGLLSISKIKGPNIQTIRQKRSNLDNSDNAARLSYQTFCVAFMIEKGLPNLGISLVKISFSL